MIERGLMEYIANAVWQIPLLAGGAWILLWMVRPRPQVQHGVWLAVLGLAALLPMHGMGAASGVPVVRAQSVAVGAQVLAGAQGSTVAWGERDVPLETEGCLGRRGCVWSGRLGCIACIWLRRLCTGLWRCMWARCCWGCFGLRGRGGRRGGWWRVRVRLRCALAVRRVLKKLGGGLGSGCHGFVSRTR